MTSDDELIERVRRTLRAEAAALRPKPEEYPTQGEAQKARIIPLRARWPLGALAVAAAAAVIVALTVIPGGGKSHKIGTDYPASSTFATEPSTTTAVAVPTTMAPSGVGLVPTTTSTVPPSPVVAGFQPRSVTFVSPRVGWALGLAPCSSGSGNCLAMAQTFDNGASWSGVAAPNAGPVDGTVSLRFANGLDGWVYETTANSSELWSTHDGGAAWIQVTLPGHDAQGQIMALEVSGATARLIDVVPGAAVELLSSPIGSDDWTAAPVTVPIGGGPVPSSQLMLQKSSGWMLENNRTVVGGASLASNGQWQSWTPPCANANGEGGLTASSTSDVAAICSEGVEGPSGQSGAVAGSNWLYTSTNGGASFQAVGPLPSGYSASTELTSASSSTFVVATLADSDPGTAGSQTVHATAGAGDGASVAVLLASFDGGHTWARVFSSTAVSDWTDLGFTSADQAVAIAISSMGTSELLMTYNGGHSWTPVNFG